MDSHGIKMKRVKKLAILSLFSVFAFIYFLHDDVGIEKKTDKTVFQVKIDDILFEPIRISKCRLTQSYTNNCMNITIETNNKTSLDNLMKICPILKERMVRKR